MVKGEGLRATFDGEKTACGFFKTEYVWAGTPEQAAAKARENVTAALRSMAADEADLKDLRLDIDEIEGNLGLSKMLRKEGFVFHRLDAETHH